MFARLWYFKNVRTSKSETFVSNKNHLFISALPLNCSPITIVKSMDHTCLGRNGSISTCFPERAKHRWRDLCRPNVTNLLCRWHQQFLPQFPSHGQLQGLLGPNTWEMWMGVWHRSQNAILNLQPMDVVLSWRFLSSKEGTCWQVCAFVPLYSRLFETLLNWDTWHDWDPCVKNKVAMRPRYPIMIPEQGGCVWIPNIMSCGRICLKYYKKSRQSSERLNVCAIYLRSVTPALRIEHKSQSFSTT